MSETSKKTASSGPLSRGTSAELMPPPPPRPPSKAVGSTAAPSAQPKSTSTSTSTASSHPSALAGPLVHIPISAPAASTPSRARDRGDCAGSGTSPIPEEQKRSVEAVCGQLGPRWAQLCGESESTKFSWSHNGSQRNGWVELKENGQLETTWCRGTWKVHEADSDLVDLNFGSSRHVCRIREGGFLVEQKFSMRTNKDSYKPGQPKSCGFIRAFGEGSQRGTPTPRKTAKPLTGGPSGASAQAPPRKKPRTALEAAAEGTLRAGKGEAADVDRPTFVQKDLKLAAFFTNWQDWTLKRFDVPVI
mmetsp:Transcript_34213/g.72869  ORF Transcript_34213/g.72869 Transcript_34213/m.72869 type:complete len:304 (+) Transcript_34213:158-1069(+)|eukprot:CAMPEP_0206459188 /NCGR_PEP_ID=MMETSP0324_2-20121206/24028_1 /ASSEMBLY_ACC=CAM_ASM_000836 /TAXON_ID=2866 /ORGANISM="Crypthecodinium cohnii, Strain Seligo" /LENGTH=303 /DNA_ID=CAMNT_0053930693 /DNA_START=88 /DNA_END=999 /DNA_ORIENTATION=+